MEPSPTNLKKEFMEPYEKLKKTTEKEISDLQWKKAAAFVSSLAVGIFATLSSIVVLGTTFLLAWGSVSLILFTPCILATIYTICAPLIVSSLTIATVASMAFFMFAAHITLHIGSLLLEPFGILFLFDFSRNKESEFHVLDSEIKRKKNEIIKAYNDAKNRWNAQKTERQTLCTLARQNVIDYTNTEDYNGIIPSDAPLWNYLPPELRQEIADLVLV